MLQPQQSQRAPKAVSVTAHSKLAPRPLSNIREGSDASSEQDDLSRERPIPHWLYRASQPNKSTASLPATQIPTRKSSTRQLKEGVFEATTHDNDIANDTPALSLPPPRGLGHTIPARGRSSSPVRHVVERLNPTSSGLRRIPSRTFVRSIRPTDILDVPRLNHPKVSLEIRTSAPLFVGGGTVEGELEIGIHTDKIGAERSLRTPMSIGRVSIDVLGVERSYGRQKIYRSLANELIDETHPPPSHMITAPRALFDAFWDVTPSRSVLPFRLDLPVNMGPPPYSARNVSIRYILCATLAMRVGGKQHFVRRSQEIAILTVHDPEKALVNLSEPLTAHDESYVSRLGCRSTIHLTAGVHRQTWLSGISMFVDVHIVNESHKSIKKLALQVEKVTTFFDSAAASTTAEAAGHLRLPDRTQREIVVETLMKTSRHGWQGIGPKSRYIRTCSLDLPCGLVTIDTGRFFGVRFFLKIHVSVAYSKHLMVEIPITIIHPNSLDIVPNSLAQVAAAIEQKRGHSSPGQLSPYHYNQGSAFTAARRQSYERLGSQALPIREIEDLTKQLDSSPRKHQRKQPTHSRENSGATAKQGKGINHVAARTSLRQRCSIDSVRGPRLQRSTSGLLFSDDDYSSSNSSVYSLDGNGHPIADEFRKKEASGGYRPGFRQSQSRSPSRTRTRSLSEKIDGQIQRELSLARRRSRVLGEGSNQQGWRNIAAEESVRFLDIGAKGRGSRVDRGRGKGEVSKKVATDWV